MPLAAVPLAFGKLPAHGDFVRLGAPSPALDALDGWLQEGMAAARHHPLSPPTTFHFLFAPPEAPHVLAGALRMSSDRVGRRYPFLAGYAVDRWQVDARDAFLWPVTWHGALAAAARLVSDVDSLDARAAEAQLNALPPLPDARDRAARQAHEATCYQTTMGTFWATLDLEPTSRDALFAAFLHALDGARAPAPPTHGIDYPLPRVAPPLEAAAVWAEAEWRLRGRRTSRPALFWTGPQDGAHLLTFAHGPPNGALAALTGAPISGKALLRLHHADPLDTPPLSLRHQRLVGYEALSVTQFLHAL
jgi:type VI secretion system protein ImpM